MAANLYSSAYLEQTATLRVAAVVSLDVCFFILVCASQCWVAFPPSSFPYLFCHLVHSFCVVWLEWGRYGEEVRLGGGGGCLTLLASVSAAPRLLSQALLFPFFESRKSYPTGLLWDGLTLVIIPSLIRLIILLAGVWYTLTYLWC